MDTQCDELCIGWILELLSFTTHIGEEISIVPFHDDREERMFSKTRLDEDIFPEFLRVVNGMEELLLHPIVRNREIRLEEDEDDMVDLLESPERTIGSQDDICRIDRLIELGFLLMRIRIESENHSIREDASDIFLDLLDPDTDRGEPRSMAIRTLVGNRINIVALMTDQILSRSRMIGKCDITVGTEWEISTILTDPCPP